MSINKAVFDWGLIIFGLVAIISVGLSSLKVQPTTPATPTQSNMTEFRELWVMRPVEIREKAGDGPLTLRTYYSRGKELEMEGVQNMRIVRYSNKKGETYYIVSYRADPDNLTTK